MIVWFEPWAESITLAPNESVIVEVTSSSDCPVDVQQYAEGMVFFGSWGGTIRVFDNEGRMVWNAWRVLPNPPNGPV
jgi:hypothetical protein